LTRIDYQFHFLRREKLGNSLMWQSLVTMPAFSNRTVVSRWTTKFGKKIYGDFLWHAVVLHCLQ